MLVFLSPKSQDHDVGEFVEVSVNSTVSGAEPEDTDSVNDAIGAFVPALTVTEPTCVTELVPALLVASKVMV